MALYLIMFQILPVLTHCSALRIAASSKLVSHALLLLESCWSAAVEPNKSARYAAAGAINALEQETHAVAELRRQIVNFGPHNADVVLISSILLCYMARNQ
jgi:hypothetical protein